MRVEWDAPFPHRKNVHIPVFTALTQKGGVCRMTKSSAISRRMGSSVHRKIGVAKEKTF